ncbi:MAG: hypothetical protein LBU32_18720 [Clostridiales bacterium]|jgi:hypothetical protein|nr:hypothetical protein [Clostridiales bacterium]
MSQKEYDIGLGMDDFTLIRERFQYYMELFRQLYCIIHQSKQHKILAEKFKIEENICLNLQNLSINLHIS